MVVPNYNSLNKQKNIRGKAVKSFKRNTERDKNLNKIRGACPILSQRFTPQKKRKTRLSNFQLQAEPWIRFASAAVAATLSLEDGAMSVGADAGGGVVVAAFDPLHLRGEAERRTGQIYGEATLRTVT